MYVLPLQFIFTLFTTFICPMPYCDDTETIHVVGDVENTANDGVGSSSVIKSTATHLNPT